MAASIPSAPSPVAVEYPMIERRGRDTFGHTVLVLDILDPRAPSAGTVAHIDMSFHGDQAHLDGPLDSFVPRMTPGVPESADLTHVRQFLWFGLAVKPDYQGHGLGLRLLDEAVRHLRAAGVRSLFIRATESSRGFYMNRFGPRVVDIEPETDADGETTYRLEIDLR
jgi:ribosomal protein S18 acetylase RimI-like enzyme